MPFENIEPERFMFYRGISVYHYYPNEDANSHATYWYNTDVDEDESWAFDVRELETLLINKGLMPANLIVENDEHETIIKLGIDHDLIDLPEGVKIDDPGAITKEQEIDYLQDGQTCPFCGAQADFEGGFVEINANEATQSVTCSLCEKSWVSYFKLFRIEPL